MKHYDVFSGRGRRPEYWLFTLVFVIISIIAMIIDNILGTTFSFSIPDLDTGETTSVSAGYGYVYLIVTLIHLLPALSAMVRRLHDTGRSGWNYWWALIPLVGAIVVLVFLCLPTKPEANKYGPEPLAA